MKTQFSTIYIKNKTMMLSQYIIRIQQQQRRKHRIVKTIVKQVLISNFVPIATTTVSDITTRRNSSDSNKKLNESNNNNNKQELLENNNIHMSVSHGFPDFIEAWNPTKFRNVGYGLCALTAATFPMLGLGPGLVSSILTGGYWYIGIKDLKQSSHAIRRNYPVLGNMRYILEVIRPELRQYIVESDTDGKPFDRMHRAQVYQRAKNVDDTIAFGTRRDLYTNNAEWACHSTFPKQVKEESRRVMIGSKMFGCKQPYSASRFNISAMSYGALSDTAILALSTGAKNGGFYHNTGEGGVSAFHLQGGGDLVWNIGTGYFGCGTGTTQRVFDDTLFQNTLHEEAKGKIKMIEIKLSQGAKPGHGGLLPKQKISKEIAFARKLPFPPEGDCHSPSSHSAFSSFEELVQFINHLRYLSNGLPIGIKMCVGHPHEFVSLCSTIQSLKSGPDFITIDGSEGGTGAAPPEFTNTIGLPLEEGLTLAHNILTGYNLRDQIALIASGKITSGFSIVRAISLGADVTNSARGFMFSLGCIQALKCNTNKCPTGIATTDKSLMVGLDPILKSHRVYNFHNKTLLAACDIVGAIGFDDFRFVDRDCIMRRVGVGDVRTFSEIFPSVKAGSLLLDDGRQPGLPDKIVKKVRNKS